MKNIFLITIILLFFTNYSFAQFGNYNSYVKTDFDRFMFNSQWGLTLNLKQNFDPVHTYGGLGYFYIYKFYAVAAIFETSMHYGFQSKYFLNDLSAKFNLHRLVLPVLIGVDINIYHNFMKTSAYISPIIGYDKLWICLYYAYSFKQKDSLCLKYTNHLGLILRPQIVFNLLMNNYNQWGHHLYNKHQRKSRRSAARQCRNKPVEPKIKPASKEPNNK